MPEPPAFLKSSWLKLAGVIVVALISYLIGTKGQETIVLTPEAKTEIRVVHDTLEVTAFDTLTQVDTLWKSAPDTCQRWVKHYKTLWERTRDSLRHFQAQSRGGTIHVRDSTYSWLRVAGSFTYPEGGGRLSYTLLKQPYFDKPRFALGFGLPLLDFPWAKLDYRYKNNRWIGITAQPKIQDSKLKSEFGISHRWEF